jgi:Lrp/AsnC family leucine-responsive transcriptional regulator
MREDSFSDRIDELDRALLERLQADGRASNSRLAEEVGLSETPCWRRVKRLESDGIISGYTANLDRRKLGLGVFAFVEVKFSTHDTELSMEFEKAVDSIPQILTCHNVAGDVDYILQVVARDLDDYGRFTAVLRNLPGVTAIHSILSLREVKKFTGLPLG